MPRDVSQAKEALRFANDDLLNAFALLDAGRPDEAAAILKDLADMVFHARYCLLDKGIILDSVLAERRERKV